MKEILKKPDWIRVTLSSNKKSEQVRNVLLEGCHVTVCEEAHCPNKAECFSRGTATFMIMGDICTRRCQFCNVSHGKPKSLDSGEPERLAKTILNLGLKYVVITSVDRDDLADGGANHYVECLKAIRKFNPGIKVEVLVPDFRRCLEGALELFSLSPPDVFGHNVETVPRLFDKICSSANYQVSLELLNAHKMCFPDILTKSGLMLGLGETDQEIEEVLDDLRYYKVDLLTLGQYLRPSINHVPVDRYVTPAKFEQFAELAKQKGFTGVMSGPMVRSSYHADKLA